jgi:hypothetical protein
MQDLKGALPYFQQLKLHLGIMHMLFKAQTYDPSLRTMNVFQLGLFAHVSFSENQRSKSYLNSQ